MDQHDWVAERFEAKRTHLRAVAYRMLGSLSEADDAVQEAWLRVTRADTSGVENLGGWLTTIVARVCLDMLRTRKTRGEEPLDPLDTGEEWPDADGSDARVGHAPERDTLLADSIGIALLVVLETLAPAERVAFVLHDMFDLSFDEIAPIVGRSPVAARQLASRARRRVQGASTGSSADADRRARQRQIVNAFLAAARGGDMTALLALLDPDVVVRADRVTPLTGATNEVRGRQAVADVFAGRARAAQPALIDGAPGLVWAQGGVAQAAFAFTLDGDRIATIELILDPERLARMELVFGRALLGEQGE